MKVIGAGFPRTGTTTLKWALETLGYSQCYHMTELLKKPGEIKYWEMLDESGNTDWEQLFLNYQACVDFPGYSYYKILMEKYPDAKVVLTIMPFDSWYKSINATIAKVGPQTVKEKFIALCQYPFSSKLRKIIKINYFFKMVFWDRQFEGEFSNKAKVKVLYYKHIKAVTDYVPAERLLIYEVSQGWEPLCRFLGVSIPGEKFKHLNKGIDFRDMLNDILK